MNGTRDTLKLVLLRIWFLLSELNQSSSSLVESPSSSFSGMGWGFLAGLHAQWITDFTGLQWGIFDPGAIQPSSMASFHIQGGYQQTDLFQCYRSSFFLLRHLDSWGGFIILLSSLVSDAERLSTFQPCFFIWPSSWISIMSAVCKIMFQFAITS